MTKEEKLAILADAEARCYEALKTAEVGKDMASIVGALEDVEWRVKGLTGERDEYLAKLNTPNEQTDSPTPVSAETAAETPTPAPAPKTKRTTPPPGTESGMTKAEMVSKLTTFQTNGVAIDKVMESMGYTKLSQVPANQYEKLLELCQEALDGEG